MSNLRMLQDLDVVGRVVFVRVDFNVPLEGTKVTDDTRIRAAIPTIKYIMEKGGRVLLASHLGRPKGKAKPEFSLEPAALRLAELMNVEVLLADDCVGDGARKVVTDLRDTQIAMLENLRFHAAEEEDDETFARELAKLAEVYVNDAFGCSHRAHASVHALPKLMHQRAAGLLVHKEVAALEKLRSNPDHPFVAVLGGAKVSDKLEVIQNLLPKVDALVIGGAMAYTFLKERGLPTGKSLVEADSLASARAITDRARELGVRLELPSDHVVAPALDANAPRETLAIDDPAIGERMGLDIGPKTAQAYASILATARTVVWNGPMGVFEIDAFSKGTAAVAEAVAQVKGTTIIGGGDSIAAIHKAGVADRVSHISTGGGASLEFLGGRVLPGVAALTDK
jgi:phosphoglycerate kinase